MQRGLRNYIYIVAALGGLLTGWAIFYLATHPTNWPDLLIFMGMVILVELTATDLLPGSRASISVSSAVYFAGILTFGPFGGMLVALCSGLAASVMSIRMAADENQARSPMLRRALFNMGAFAISSLIAGFVYVSTGGTPGVLEDLALILPILISAITLDLVNAGLVVGVVSLQTGQAPFQVWRDNLMWAAPINILTMAIGGGTLALGYQSLDWLGLGVFLLPVIATSYAFRLYVQRTKAQMAHLEEIIAERTAELQTVNQELRRADQQKTQFYSIINHEMRTPLTSILGYCDLLRIKGDLDPKAQDFVEVIKDNGQRLLDLVNNLLDVSRIEAGRMTLSQEPTELDELVVHAVRMIGPLAEQKHIKVETELAEETPRVFVDTKKISQVLINLLSNAVKYTPDTGEVTVSTALADTGDMVQVDVADTGIGIPASELPTIFDRFSRVDSEETRDTVGTGLGLTITKGFVEGHGGDIWVESEEGVGSVFHFTLPTYQGQASETTQ